MSFHHFQPTASATTVPADNTDSWLDNCSNTVSQWKGKTITYLQNTEVYKFIDQNILTPCRTLEKNHPKVYAVALAALSIFTAILTLDLARSAVKRTFFAAVPIGIIFFYSQLLILMADKISQAWKELKAPQA